MFQAMSAERGMLSFQICPVFAPGKCWRSIWLLGTPAHIQSVWQLHVPTTGVPRHVRCIGLGPATVLVVQACCRVVGGSVSGCPWRECHIGHR